jgi:hypothetical protein
VNAGRVAIGAEYVGAIILGPSYEGRGWKIKVAWTYWTLGVSL